jgi:hypothetical protein
MNYTPLMRHARLPKVALIYSAARYSHENIPCGFRAHEIQLTVGEVNRLAEQVE